MDDQQQQAVDDEQEAVDGLQTGQHKLLLVAAFYNKVIITMCDKIGCLLVINPACVQAYGDASHDHKLSQTILLVWSSCSQS